MLTYLVGSADRPLATRPLPPYSDEALAFLAALSVSILGDKEAKEYPDVIAFGYWARKANLSRLEKEFGETRARLGAGTVFHITPSNVPVNFAFSFAFGLLAGNANIVRVPTRDFAQVRIIARLVTKLFTDAKYVAVAEMTQFVRYEQDDAITGEFSARCDARVIWGGDQAIKNIRAIRIPERANEVVFADRYSFSVMDAAAVVDADDTHFTRLVTGFFNDAFVMDQNACSSPHLVVWVGKGKKVADAQARFWDALHKHSESRYELQPVAAVDKFAQLCRNAVAVNGVRSKQHGNYVVRVEFEDLPENVDSFRGKFGFFYEYATASLNDVGSVVNNKYQTLTYFGVEKDVLREFVVSNRLAGIDRIVPVGAALDMGVIWDGYDVIRSLSRVIELA